eukprot:CAMPEP_0116142698 /NCGR_PEP_ID=MMETSP0329-20121206/15049_1 /TAXON_ID=697910 /ORGANISM="Pseudo-nitzschia arenysensis, Strain B593" /LENGTH=275 /DNA_ID=CAMNT_0003637955 /DNA_START=12 /DNA_END=839 /DNA_ORIENTATION=-
MVEEAHTEPVSPLTLLEEKLTEQQKVIEGIQGRLQVLEADEDEYYPHDTYAMISLNWPCPGEKTDWSFFLFGVMIWLFQMVLIVLLGASVFLSFYDTEDYYAGDLIMAITEFAAILAYAVIPDASIQDIVTANKLWPTTKSSEHSTGRKIACTLRGIQGIGASVCVMFLINVSPTAIDIILNFAALNFVSDMDSVAFELASKGVFGQKFQKHTGHIQSHKLPERARDVETPYRVAMISCFVIMTTVNAVLTGNPELAKALYTAHSAPSVGAVLEE